MMNIEKFDETIEDGVVGAMIDLHHLSVEQLAELGVAQIAYVRKVITNQGPAVGVFAANGAPLAVASSDDLARAAIVQNDMAPVSVH
ncbi:MAG TPA: DUF1150 family protein [Acidiphilium sp.]|nr:DUF1150 family protein [Acidiphilium sp.]HQU22987.1 DUF1150 family protein [Acidiphilium sp.]